MQQKKSSFTCQRKRRYKAKEDAEQALSHAKKTMLCSSTLQIYKCECCNEFHLGNEAIYNMNYEQLLRFTEDLLMEREKNNENIR